MFFAPLVRPVLGSSLRLLHLYINISIHLSVCAASVLLCCLLMWCLNQLTQLGYWHWFSMFCVLWMRIHVDAQCDRADFVTQPPSIASTVSLTLSISRHDTQYTTYYIQVAFAFDRITISLRFMYVYTYVMYGIGFCVNLRFSFFGQNTHFLPEFFRNIALSVFDHENYSTKHTQSFHRMKQYRFFFRMRVQRTHIVRCRMCTIHHLSDCTV